MLINVCFLNEPVGSAYEEETVFLMISSLLNIAYLMPIVARGFFFAPPGGPERPEVKEAPLMCLIPLCVTAVAGVALFFFADKIYQWLLPIAGGVAG